MLDTERTEHQQSLRKTTEAFTHGVVAVAAVARELVVRPVNSSGV